MPKPKEMGFGERPPPKERSTQKWPDSYIKGGKRSKSPQGKGFAKGKVLKVTGPVKVPQKIIRANVHGYHENLNLTSGECQNFNFYKKNHLGNWVFTGSIGRKEAQEVAASFNEEIPDWNEEIELGENLKLKGGGCNEDN